MTHSSFITLLPAYLLSLWLGGHDTRRITDALTHNISVHSTNLATKGRLTRGTLSPSGRTRVITGVIVLLTIGLTLPSLSWFLAVPLTSMGNITAIYNTFSIWALVLAVLVLGEPWRMRDIGSVVLACGGVALVAYGGATGSNVKGTHRLAGDSLALLGAVSMAAYEVCYRVVATYDEGAAGGYAPLVEQPQGESDERESAESDAVEYTPLPFGLFAIAITTAIGLATILLFLGPLVAAHILGLETLELPQTAGTTLVILLSVTCGVLFNGAFSASLLTCRITLSVGTRACVCVMLGNHCDGAVCRHCARDAVDLVQHRRVCVGRWRLRVPRLVLIRRIFEHTDALYVTG